MIFNTILSLLLTAMVAYTAPVTNPTKLTAMMTPPTAIAARQWDAPLSAPAWSEPAWTPPSAIPTPWSPSTTPDPDYSHTDPEADKSIRITTGTIVGLIFGSMVIFGIIGVVVLCWKRRAAKGENRGLGDVETRASIAGHGVVNETMNSRGTTGLLENRPKGGVSGVKGLQVPKPVYKGGLKDQPIHSPSGEIENDAKRVKERVYRNV